MLMKQLLAIILLSLVVLFANSTLNDALHHLIDFHQWISDALVTIFSSGKTGDIIKAVLALLLVPAVLAGVPALVYWGMKRTLMPYLWPIIWTAWIIQAVAVTLSSHVTIFI